MPHGARQMGSRRGKGWRFTGPAVFFSQGSLISSACTAINKWYVRWLRAALPLALPPCLHGCTAPRV